tara:strand:+ start:222 stop:353 length:132 start_codon:yes stop_codon:yes gene_type:complete
MNFIKKILAKIGGPVWRAVQTTKHSTLGAIIVVVVIGLIVWVV